MRDGTPKGYAFIHFAGNQYTVDYKTAGKPQDYQMKVFTPKVVAKGKRTKSGVFANFFMGSKKDKVMYRVDQGEWKEMDYVQAESVVCSIGLRMGTFRSIDAGKAFFGS